MQTGPMPRLPADLHADLAAFEEELRRFEQGTLPEAEFKPRRGLRGVYEERTTGSFMLRTRIPGGVLPQAQAAALAALGQRFGNGTLHLTTRQDIQFHGLRQAQLIPLMHELLHAGIACKGGGGNAVRNHAVCPHAGACPHEPFDVTPAAQATAEFLLANPGSYTLPRKFKLAFSGCAADCALARICDLGFIAALRDGQPGFRVYSGGGMGALSRPGDLLLDWIPPGDVLPVAEAARRLFARLGDRTNRARARLRYVCERLGPERFRAEFESDLASVCREERPAWNGAPTVRPAMPPPGAGMPAPRLTRAGLRLYPQYQQGLVTLHLHAPLGDLPAADLARLADRLIPLSGERALRLTRTQNLLLRHLPEAALPEAAAVLRTLQTDLAAPAALDRFTACVGAGTCRIGACRSRAAARACAALLEQQGVTREILDHLEFHFNGCVNACGQQPIAAIGARGVLAPLGGQRVPSYDLSLGGRCDAAGVRLGVAAGRVPAARLPQAMHELATVFAAQRAPGERFLACLERIGAAPFLAVLARHAVREGEAVPAEWTSDLQG